MKFIAILTFAVVTTTIAALPMPNPINWMIPSFIPLETCKLPCCGYGCYLGMFQGYKRFVNVNTSAVLA